MPVRKTGQSGCRCFDIGVACIRCLPPSTFPIRLCPFDQSHHHSHILLLEMAYLILFYYALPVDEYGRPEACKVIYQPLFASKVTSSSLRGRDVGFFMPCVLDTLSICSLLSTFDLITIGRMSTILSIQHSTSLWGIITTSRFSPPCCDLNAHGQPHLQTQSFRPCDSKPRPVLHAPIF